VISGWNQAVPPPASTQALTGADRSGVGAVYKGLAIASAPAGDQLYAADFHNARVDVFDSSFNLMSTPGAFVDPKMPRNYAPFGIQNINGAIFVTYARQDKAKVTDVPGTGRGFVDMFDTSGNLMARVATHGALSAPWGLALAPSDFGALSGDLLVGNFGNGMIHAYQQQPDGRWKPHGQLKGSNGKALKISGLWGLSFGNGGPAGPTNTLYFTAGPGGGSHGLFGSIQPPAAATTTTTTPGASATTTTMAGSTGSQTHTVMVGNGGALVYSPANLTIHVGDTVRWVWASSGHSVVSGTSGNADNQFCSPSNTGCDNPPLSSKGATYEHTFTQAGTFPYYCSVHFQLGMTGTITVQ
jgi:plastocyanin